MPQWKNDVKYPDGFVFLVMVPSHLIAGAIHTRRATTILNWVVPIVVIVWAAKCTGELSAAEPAL